jgi:hypothetical protein
MAKHLVVEANGKKYIFRVINEEHKLEEELAAALETVPTAIKTQNVNVAVMGRLPKPIVTATLEIEGSPARELYLNPRDWSFWYTYED